MRAIDAIATILIIVGALNWGLVGTADFNLVAALFGESALAAIVYTLVGLSAVYFVARWAMTQRQLGAVPA